jgi:FkbM family methyltransferase
MNTRGLRHKVRTLTLELVSGSPIEPWLRWAHDRVMWTQGAQYDRETTAVMRRVLTPTSNCVDIGCYRGSLLREMVSLAPRGRHFAFEPVPENYRYLKARFPTVQVFDIALADYTGEASFQHVVGRSARSGLRRVAYPDPRQEVAEISVSVDTLDRIVPVDLKLDLLKTDVEGAELQVLRGAAGVIRRSRPMVIFECGSERSEAYGTRPEDVYDLVRADLRLEVTLMRDWLQNRRSLSRSEFCDRLYAKQDFCFLAHPAA